MMSRVFVKVGQKHIVALISLCTFFVVVKCRRVIQHTEGVENIVKRLNDINLGLTDNEGLPCLLDIQEDLPKCNTPQPLYIIPDTNQFWLPNSQGKLLVPRGAAIELYCPKSFANGTEHSNDTSCSYSSTIKSSSIFKVARAIKTVRPRCLYDKTFLWQGKKYDFRQFSCVQSPSYTVEQLQGECPVMADRRIHVDAQMYRVGFNVTGDRFLETMRICYDSTILRTLYVQHVLLPANVHFQKYIKRLNFSKAGHFKNLNINHFYTQQSQRQQAATLFNDHHQHIFNNSTLFLARGHLAAKSDFIYGNQQRSTFNFFNVAPQWQAFNSGQWATLEEEVRKFVAKSNVLVDCYTGTFGTLQLPYKTAGSDVGSTNTSTTANIVQYREFYLTVDSNNNGLLPVPQLFYRVLVDRSQHPSRGIALVGVNNPHATLSEIKTSYIICDDIRLRVGWLQWMRNTNLRKGFMYACRLPDFVAAVGYLPRSLLNIKELLI